MVYNDINESNYTYKYNDLVFYFSSNFYKEKYFVNSNVLIPRAMEEFIKWSDNSKIKKKLDEVYGDYDDFKYN